jgi:hypothetical protein
MQIKVVDSLDVLNSLKDSWNNLFLRSGQRLFMHHTWVYHNYKCFNPTNILLLAVYAECHELIGVFPFTIKNFKIKGLSYKVLTHSCSSLTDLSTFVIDPSANRRLMINRIINKLTELQPSSWDFYKLDNLSDGDPVASLFRNLLLKILYAGEIMTEITPSIDYGHQYEEAKKISNIRRRFKKLTGEGVFEYKVGSEIDADDMREFSELHQIAFPGASFDQENSQVFFRGLINDKEFGNKVCFSTLRQEGKIMAAHFGFSDEQCFYYYVPTYNEDFASYGVGQYLLLSLINRAEQDGKNEFNLLRGSESYKYNWMNTTNNNYTVFAAPIDASWFRKLLVNIWLFNKVVPFFTR